MDRKPKVVFIDDEEAFLEIYNAKFTQAGFEVAVCLGGAEAFSKVKAFKPDIILLDLVMPEVDGIDILKKLKSDPETKWIAVVMLSNMNNLSDKEECMRQGASQYLIKADVTPEELRRHVEEIVKNSAK